MGQHNSWLFSAEISINIWWQHNIWSNTHTHSLAVVHGFIITIAIVWGKQRYVHIPYLGSAAGVVVECGAKCLMLKHKPVNVGCNIWVQYWGIWLQYRCIFFSRFLHFYLLVKLLSCFLDKPMVCSQSVSGGRGAGGSLMLCVLSKLHVERMVKNEEKEERREREKRGDSMSPNPSEIVCELCGKKDC